MPPERKSKARRFEMRVSKSGDQKLDEPAAGSTLKSASAMSCPTALPQIIAAAATHNARNVSPQRIEPHPTQQKHNTEIQPEVDYIGDKPPSSVDK